MSTLRMLVILACICSSTARADEGPSPSAPNPVIAHGLWALTQFIPSPMLVIGRSHVGGGLRWQFTPFLYSFGVAGSPVRLFLVSPVARHSGSVELHVSPEWTCCAPRDRTSWLLRVGARLYFPLLEHGELLSWSFGTSYHRASAGDGAAVDLGLYTLFGILGLTATVSPWLERREITLALNIRYF